ncbi:hypothetical protein ABID16_000759 [Rhizobium aquaticum]|uniref:Uncharacterized protein n=1 Tax=Rhizobium aquaticum TaxID=1549636 RepID=A0ABV2IXT1_9HYPH
MQPFNIRKLAVSILVLLCLGLAPFPVSSLGIVGPGTPSLAGEKHEAQFALPFHRNAVQILASARDPHPPFAGGAIAAVLPSHAGLEYFQIGAISSVKATGAVSSTEPAHRRARSPPLS